MDLIEADSAFVTQLASPDVACITWPQREHIVEMLHRRDRSKSLLDFLTRRSVAAYKNFIKVLAERQAHLVCLLEADGGEILFTCSFRRLLIQTSGYRRQRVEERLGDCNQVQPGAFSG